MSCEACRVIEAAVDPNAPHVLRKCATCGSDYRALDRPKDGIGIDVKAGDRFILPAEFIRIAANPLKGSGQLSRAGLTWFAEQMFDLEAMKVERTPESLTAVMAKRSRDNQIFFRDSPLLSGLDQKGEAGATEAAKRISEVPQSVEWYGLFAAILADVSKDAIVMGNAAEAAWAAAYAERFRALAVFRRDFEEVAFMGHCAYRIIRLLKIWDANQANDNEAFWQAILTEHSYAFSQMYSVPMTLIAGNAYVGGMKIDRTDARFLDFLFAGGTGRQAMLVEIKTPTTQLMKSKKYRSIYPPSSELSGAVAQIQDYSETLAREAAALVADQAATLNTHNARKMILIGNYEKEFGGNIERAAAFDRYRQGLSNLEVVTFDEFFRKLEHLASVFGLSRVANLPGETPSRPVLR